MPNPPLSLSLSLSLSLYLSIYLSFFLFAFFLSSFLPFVSFLSLHNAHLLFCRVLLGFSLISSSSSSCRAASTDIQIPSRHFSLSFIASGRSSGLHPISSHCCCMYVRAGHPAFARPYAGVHWSRSLISSSLLLQHCPACPVRLACIVFVMGGRWPYSWCLVGCCCQDLFNIARSILV